MNDDLTNYKLDKLQEAVDRIVEAIHGNGKKGLVERVGNIETVGITITTLITLAIAALALFK